MYISLMQRLELLVLVIMVMVETSISAFLVLSSLHKTWCSLSFQMKSKKICETPSKTDIPQTLKMSDQDRELLANLKQDASNASKSNESQATKEHIANSSTQPSYTTNTCSKNCRRSARQTRLRHIPSSRRLQHQR